MSAFSLLLADSTQLVVQEAQMDSGKVAVCVRSTASASRCPLCNQPSESVHSRYVRKLADLPRHGQATAVQLQVRRFRCLLPQCTRRIFAERFPFVAAFARTTRRLHDTHAQIGLFLGGEGGARLATRLAMKTSPDTLLRRIRQLPLPSAAPVRILGVDDWAFRKGHTYGTILCDLEQRRPVDLLPERSAESLRQWLLPHPEVEIITRDRGDDYIKGATIGAPQAVQVADRWHLLRNLSDAVRRLVDRLAGRIRRAVEELPADSPLLQPVAVPDEVGEKPCIADQSKPTRYRQRQQERRQRRLERYQQVKELHQQGVAHREIGRRLGMNRATVRTLVRAESFPERAPRLTPRRTDELTDYLRDRWNDGYRNAARLFEDLNANGFNVSYHMVRRRLARWREQAAQGATDGSALAPRRPRFSARRIVRLLLKADTEVSDNERTLRERVEQLDGGLARTANLGRRFREMVRERKQDVWENWLDEAQESATPQEMRTFAKGLQEDQAAVRAALSHEWSNGQVEGQVNRLKTLKRQMFGRAKFDLLRRRFLLAI
jgi:transposase